MANLNEDGRQPVICGTDFSIHAEEAASLAGLIAKRFQCGLILLHVEEPRGLEASHPEVEAVAQDRSRALMKKETARLQDLGASVKGEISSGSPYVALAQAASDSNARLVVVGSIGQVGPSRLLAGSVAERTAETSPAPTLLVRRGEALSAWVRGERKLKVVVGCDFSESTDAALRWLAGWHELGPCDITAVHVDWPPGAMRRLGLSGPVSLTENHPELARILHRELKEKVDGFLGARPVAIRISPGWGRCDDHLIELAGEENADLLVVGTHQRHGFGRLLLGSVSRGVLHHAPMSVAVIPHGLISEDVSRTIPDIKRVLVTTDLSNFGNHAIPYAYAALRQGGCVRLIHVIPPWQPPGLLSPQLGAKHQTEKQHKQLACESLEKLRSLIPAAGEMSGIRTEVAIVGNEDIPMAICQDAERFGAQLICIGSHGRTGVLGKVLGSVAQSVMGVSHRPVLVVRPPSS